MLTVLIAVLAVVAFAFTPLGRAIARWILSRVWQGGSRATHKAVIEQIRDMSRETRQDLLESHERQYKALIGIVVEASRALGRAEARLAEYELPEPSGAHPVHEAKAKIVAAPQRATQRLGLLRRVGLALPWFSRGSRTSHSIEGDENVR